MKSSKYYINMFISEELKEMSIIRQKWVDARLNFNHIEANKQLEKFNQLKNDAYAKLKAEYIEKGISFNHRKIWKIAAYKQEEKVLMWGDGNDIPTIEWIGNSEKCPVKLDEHHYWMSFEEVGDLDYYGHGPSCNCDGRFCKSSG